MPVSPASLGRVTTAEGFMEEIMLLSSWMSCSGRGLLKHFCWREWISVGERMES